MLRPRRRSNVRSWVWCRIFVANVDQCDGAFADSHRYRGDGSYVRDRYSSERCVPQLRDYGWSNGNLEWLRQRFVPGLPNLFASLDVCWGSHRRQRVYSSPVWRHSYDALGFIWNREYYMSSNCSVSWRMGRVARDPRGRPSGLPPHRTAKRGAAVWIDQRRGRHATCCTRCPNAGSFSVRRANKRRNALL